MLPGNLEVTVCRRVLLHFVKETEICMYESHRQCRVEQQNCGKVASSQPALGIFAGQLYIDLGIFALRDR